MNSFENDTPVRFDGKVYIVTGAARGLGFAYSRLLASRGASVVMNDLGSRMEGGGQDFSAVQSAVAEVTARGGIAVANGADITSESGPESIIATALESFGRVDGVINNAGIISTETFENLTPQSIQRQLDVHLFGSLAVTRAAWPALAETGGAVVFTTSAGMLGSTFTIAYNVAKSAVYGLMRSLSMVGEPLGIRVNAVMPGAETRMQGTAQDGRTGTGDQDPRLSPDNAAPMAAWLVHPECALTGQMFSTGRGHVGSIVMAAGPGYSQRDMDLEGLARHADMLDDVTELGVEVNLEAHRGRTLAIWGGETAVSSSARD